MSGTTAMHAESANPWAELYMNGQMHLQMPAGINPPYGVLIHGVWLASHDFQVFLMVESHSSSTPGCMRINPLPPYVYTREEV